MPRVKRNIQDGYNTAFAKRLRMLIEEKNITQNQLAGIVGKTRQAVNNYTLGNTAPDSDTLIKLSEYFNVSVDYLLGLSDVRAVDKDIKFICDYTGLSEKSVRILNNINSVFEYTEIINFLIEEINFRKIDKGNCYSKNLIDLLKSYYFYNCGARKDEEQMIYITSLGHIYTSREQFVDDYERVFGDFEINKNLNEFKLNIVSSNELLDSFFVTAIIDHIKEAKNQFIKRGEENGND